MKIMNHDNRDNLVESDICVIREYLAYLLSTSDYAGRNATSLHDSSHAGRNTTSMTAVDSCLFETELCKCLFNYVNDWFLNSKQQSKYHVYMMWFALRAIFTSGCILVTPEVVENDFQTYPYEFQKCFDVPVDWRNEIELKRQFWKVTAVANSLIKKCMKRGYIMPTVHMPFGVTNVIQLDWDLYGPE